MCAFMIQYTITLSEDTFELISQLVCTKNPLLTVKVMNMAKQNGSADCALFALATLTSLCLDVY